MGRNNVPNFRCITFVVPNQRSTIMRLIILLLSTAMGLPVSNCQTLYFDGSIPVQRDGIQLDLAWAGGLNFVQTSSIDLNNDGAKDLFLFDRSGNKVVILLNTGGTGTGAYTVTREFDNVYPFNVLHDWALLRDFNCDGKEDIFSYSQAGFSVYRNISDANGPAFELAKFRVDSDYITSTGGSVIANLFVSLVDLPGIVDVDGDGDLDVLTFSLLGSYMEYHKNLSMETYGNCDSLKFEVRNKCWGAFSENFNNNSVTLNNPCSSNVPNPEMPQEPGRPEYAELTEDLRAHAGSSVLPLDLGGDGLMDVLLGDISYNNLVGLYNGGTTALAFMTEEDTLFPEYDLSVDLPLFPAGYYEDVNNDGMRDLIVSPNATSLAQNFRSMWYYRNTGSDAAPLFEFQQEDLFQDRMIELGEGAIPVIFDHNADGLMDLVVSNHGYYQNGGIYEGKLALFENIGTSTAPGFELITDDYMGLSTSGIGTAMHPAFGDMDGDGDMDMYIGDLQGRLHFYRNTPSGGNALFSLQTANVTDAAGDPIDVGQFAAPIFHDLDEDGRLDLIVGERNGNLNYYRNTGNNSTPQWSLMNEDLGGVSTVEWWNITGHSVPVVYENANGDREMILGSESGWIYHYGGIEGNVNGIWNLIDSTYLDLFEGHRTAPALHDFTGDGELDLVIGNYRGGLSFWRSDDNTSVNDEAQMAAPSFTIQPNPAAEQVDLILLDPTDRKNGTWIIRNAIGQKIMHVPCAGERTVIPINELGKGIYHVSLEGGRPGLAQRLVVIGH